MFDSPEAQFAIEAVREASLLARRIQREMVTARAHEGRPLAGDRGRLRRPGARRPATGRAACPARRSIGEEQADALRLEEGIATLDQITDFVRSAIPDATPEEVCGLIDRGSGEPARHVLDARPDRRHQGIPAPRAVRRRAWRSFAMAKSKSACSAVQSLDGGCRSMRRRLAGRGTFAARHWHRPLDGGEWQRLNVSTRRRRSRRPHTPLGRKGTHERRRDRPTRREARRHRAAGRHG